MNDLSQELRDLKLAAGAVLRALGSEDKFTLRVLLVEDDENDYLLLKRHLENSESKVVYDLVWAQTVKEALDLILKSHFDVYVVDQILTPGTGVEFVLQAHQMGFLGPFIIWSGSRLNITQFYDIVNSPVVTCVDKSANLDLLERSIKEAAGLFRARRMSHYTTTGGKI